MHTSAPTAAKRLDLLRRAAVGRAEIFARTPELANEIVIGPKRELKGELPHEAFGFIGASGLGTLRIAEEQDGPGGFAANYISVLEMIAADPDVLISPKNELDAG